MPRVPPTVSHVPRLILLNGPPGVGKSTLARRYIAEHPLAFCLDIDGIRRLIGQWQQHAEESGLLARRMAVAMITEHLGVGHDVITAQFLAREQFIGELEDVAARTGSSFHELVLLDSRANAIRRFHARATDPELSAHHREAAAMIEGDAHLGRMYDDLIALLEHRPRATVVRTSAGDLVGAYRDVLAAVNGDH
jgi:predicted kinase